MLRRLFKTRHRLDDPDATVRRAAVLALDEAAAESLADDLGRLLRSDPNPDVRLACVSRVADRALLESLLDDSRLGAAAAGRLAELPGAEPSGAEPVTAAAARSNDPRVQVAALLALPPDRAATEVLAECDREVLLQLALQSRGEVRQLVLNHPLMRHTPALTALEKRSRDKDKSLNRHARRLLERRKTLRHELDGHATRAHELAVALRRRDPGLADQAWRERQQQLHQRLAETLDAHAELRTELLAFEDGSSQADATLLPDLEHLRPDPQTLRDLEPPAPTEDERAAAAEQAAGEASFAPLVSEFEALDAALRGGGSFADMAARRQTLTDRWLTAADHQPPTPAQHGVFEAVSHRYRELADAMERLQQSTPANLPAERLNLGAGHAGSRSAALWRAVAERRSLLERLERSRQNARWPDWAPPTQEHAAWLERLAEMRRELERADELLQLDLGALEQAISGLGAAVDDGHVAEAQRLLGEARGLHDALPEHAVRPLGKQLNRQAARLAELKDWQTFATTPKRESLLQTMSALADTPLAPRDQADRIKQLRQEWQALGPIAQAADGRLADRFNAEAERAFEPCRAFFAELAEERRTNLAERRRICDQLESYLENSDWSHADMKAAETIMRTARDEWRRFHPVDRNPGRKVEQRFEALQGRLHDRVKAEWDRNLAAKEALVAEAKSLAEADLPMAEKIETAKVLQRRWREVGITPRRPDQRLWRAFRGACDNIFSAREQARQAADSALEALEARLHDALATYSGVLDRAEADTDTAAEAAAAEAAGAEAAGAEAAGAEAAGAEAADVALRTFREQMAELDHLPAGRRRLLADQKKALLGRQAALQQVRRRRRQQALLTDLKLWDEAMTAVETTGAPPPATDPVGADVAAAREAARGAPVPTDDLHRLTVKAEIAAGIGSSPGDDAIRLEVQVERLQAGLAGSRDAEDARSMALSWCALGPKDEGVAPLRERLFVALAALI